MNDYEPPPEPTWPLRICVVIGVLAALVLAAAPLRAVPWDWAQPEAWLAAGVMVLLSGGWIAWLVRAVILRKPLSASGIAVAAFFVVFMVAAALLSGLVNPYDVRPMSASGVTAAVAFAGYCFTLGITMQRWARRLDDYARRYPRCAVCGYDLRGSIAADSARCPECGEAIPINLRRSLSKGDH